MKWELHLRHSELGPRIVAALKRAPLCFSSETARDHGLTTLPFDRVPRLGESLVQLAGRSFIVELTEPIAAEFVLGSSSTEPNLPARTRVRVPSDQDDSAPTMVPFAAPVLRVVYRFRLRTLPTLDRLLPARDFRRNLTLRGEDRAPRWNPG